MLEEIRIAKVATYPEDPQCLPNLRKINFLFGTNGSGKTTISRVLADPASHSTCSLTWRTGRSIETLVYNSDFVDRNFTPSMRGIFTLGEAEADVLLQITQSRDKVNELDGQIANLKQTLGEPDDSSGKRGELKILREKFETDCWKIKTEYDAVFQKAFDGVRGSKTRFCDKVLEENDKNIATLCGIEDLKSRALTVFKEDVVRINTLPMFAIRILPENEHALILVKKIVGKEDIDIGGLIRRLGNSDWVRQGLNFVEGPGQPCPFCQRSLDAELLRKLGGFFDETYVADISAIERADESHARFGINALEFADAVLNSGNPHIEVETFRPLVERLRSLIALNKGLIERKRKEPSTPVTLEPIGEALDQIMNLVVSANEKVSRHNALVDNLVSERRQLIAEIWKYLIDEKNDLISVFMKAKSNLDKAISGITSSIDAKSKELAITKAKLIELERKVTSVQPTENEINAILTSFGFYSFKLATAGTKGEAYEIVRGDGSNARETLSEGEKSFITFLYFYHLIRGSTSTSGMNADRVVVFDDPVSSLDSDVLFIVSALIKRVIADVCKGTGFVKQVFVLTHNIYFHKEVSFDPDRNKNEKRTHETFWVVRKVQNSSKITGYQSNPIKTSYEMLWEEVKSANRSALSIQNILRRILEHYFTILGNMNKDAVIAKFDGRDKQVCASLFSWINDGSHNFADDLYVIADDSTVQRYLTVFKGIFDKTDHGAHYRMMMGPDAAEPPSQFSVAMSASSI